MRLSTRSTYGMRALVELAFASSGQRPLSANLIAKRQALSAAYLEQLLHRLKKQGVVRSVRGPQGGYLLAAPPQRITMAEVVRILDGANGAEPGAGGAPPRQTPLNGGARRRIRRAESKGTHRDAQWIAQAVRRCVHERLIASLSAVTLQDLCDEVRAMAGEPLDHRYVFHI